MTFIILRTRNNSMYYQVGHIHNTASNSSTFTSAFQFTLTQGLQIDAFSRVVRLRNTRPEETMLPSSRRLRPSSSNPLQEATHRSQLVDRSWLWAASSQDLASILRIPLFKCHPSISKLIRQTDANPIHSHFSLPNVVLSIVLLIVLRTSPIASLTRISSLYSCLSKLCAVPLLAPMQVAFQPE